MVNNGGFSPQADNADGVIKASQTFQAFQVTPELYPIKPGTHSKGTFKQICVIKASWLIKMVTFYCPFFYHPHPTFFIESELHIIPF